MTANPTADDLRVIAEQVWSSYLDVDGSKPLLPVPAARVVIDVTGSVSVTGAWRGHLLDRKSTRLNSNHP